ncbi:unnamed protein product [Paramecium sonneborni]|uniref:Uncharacterized protein n=1 Tax=Paramecium sonneborni TaxID=65129 RepID=A0A8S1JY21_9CILI|nr:unnamed protein product [Paramecium sonneborni]
MSKISNQVDNQKRLNRILNQIKELVNEKEQQQEQKNYDEKRQFSKEEMIKFIKEEYQQLSQEVRKLQVFRKNTFGSPPRNK